ncbi:MAG: DegT/DnrJ/EryC1/StrS family aminotransferase [Vicinamibacterales bacterium]
MSVRIPISRPYFGEEERLALTEPLETGWVVQGPRVQAFEQAFAARIGAAHAAATTSCTTALHLAVAALGLAPGDEVIVPAFTWISTANVVEHMGARPVFCDIDLATFNIDVRQIEARITSRTVGIIPVHLFGLCADMPAVSRVAAANGLWVLEDAACGFGAAIDGRHAGTLGTAGCFSFHPRKAITTGEGGMVTTADAELDRRVRSLRDHGASRSDLERHVSTRSFLLSDYDLLGYNYRMTDFQGALGVVQLARGDEILGARRRIAARYDAALAGAAWLDLPACPDGYTHGYQSYVCLFRPEAPTLARMPELHDRRNAIMARLEARGIATRQGTHAPPFTGFYAAKYGYRLEDFPQAALAERLSLSLPVYTQLTDAEVDEVCSALRDAFDA